MVTIAERVRAGAELLDREWPGWAERIALDRLDMWDYENCILGQLYGDFRYGFATLFPGASDWETIRMPIIHGFTSDTERCDDLIVAWWAAIAPRLGAESQGRGG